LKIEYDSKAGATYITLRKLKKNEFVDKTVVFPPKNINFNDVAIVVHFQINQEGIISNPIKPSLQFTV
jgi:uncharacterized protein YuzE